VDSIVSGRFSRGDKNLFRPLVEGLMYSDPYLLFADYQDYVDCQDRVCATFLDQERWSKMAIYNTARIGKFSSDRSIQEYCKNIWNVTRFKFDETPVLAAK
jgi:glycogen phosphorylase